MGLLNGDPCPEMQSDWRLKIDDHQDVNDLSGAKGAK